MDVCSSDNAEDLAKFLENCLKEVLEDLDGHRKGAYVYLTPRIVYEESSTSTLVEIFVNSECAVYAMTEVMLKLTLAEKALLKRFVACAKAACENGRLAFIDTKGFHWHNPSITRSL